MSEIVASNLWWPGMAGASVNADGVLYDAVGTQFRIVGSGQYEIASVDLPLSGISGGIPPGLITVGIYVADGLPTGSAILSGVFNGSEMPLLAPPQQLSAMGRNVPLTGDPLTGGVIYAVVAAPQFPSEGFRWYVDWGTYLALRRRIETGKWEAVAVSGGLRVWGSQKTDAPGKPKNPNPANAAVSVALGLSLLTWESGS